MRPPRPLVAAAVAGLAVALAACGSATSPAPPPRIPPLAASGQTAADGAAIAFPAPAQVDYRIAGTLANVATHAAAYRLDTTTTTARVALLASAFGLARVQTDASGWTADDGSHALRVQRSAGLPWTLTTAGPVAVGGSGCAVASPGSTSGGAPGGAGGGLVAPTAPGPAAPVVTAPVAPPPTCPPPTTAPGLPSQAAAVQAARSVLTKAGIDLTEATLDASGGSSDWTISVTRSLGGVPVVGSIATITVGPLESFAFASGYLADAVAVGDYPLVGVPGGVQRLRDGGRWILFGGPGPVPMTGIANGTAAVGAPATAVAPSAPSPPATSALGAPGSTVSGANAPAPAPPPTAICDGATCTTSVTAPATCGAGAPCPTIPVPVRTIQAVHLGLAWATPTDPTAAEAWLLPVYVFEFDGGMTMSVLAVSDSFLSAASETSTTPPSTPSPTPSVEPQPAPAVTPPSAVSPASP